MTDQERQEARDQLAHVIYDSGELDHVSDLDRWDAACNIADAAVAAPELVAKAAGWDVDEQSMCVIDDPDHEPPCKLTKRYEVYSSWKRVEQ